MSAQPPTDIDDQREFVRKTQLMFEVIKLALETDSHANTNLPVLLAGGGFRHGQHLALDRGNNYPLTNLFVSMLQRLGVEVNEFSTGRGTLRDWRWHEP